MHFSSQYIHALAPVNQLTSKQDTQVQQRLISEIFTLVSARPASSCNFLPLPPLLAPNQSSTSTIPETHNDTPSLVTYRHYATLYFIMISTSTESPLALLDLIQVFVESLDRLFENVCELDLIFNFETLHAVLGEMIVGGVVVETGLDRYGFSFLLFLLLLLHFRCNLFEATCKWVLMSFAESWKVSRPRARSPRDLSMRAAGVVSDLASGLGDEWCPEIRGQASHFQANGLGIQTWSMKVWRILTEAVAMSVWAMTEKDTIRTISGSGRRALYRRGKRQCSTCSAGDGHETRSSSGVNRGLTTLQ